MAHTVVYYAIIIIHDIHTSLTSTSSSVVRAQYTSVCDKRSACDILAVTYSLYGIRILIHIRSIGLYRIIYISCTRTHISVTDIYIICSSIHTVIIHSFYIYTRPYIIYTYTYTYYT